MVLDARSSRSARVHSSISSSSNATCFAINAAESLADSQEGAMCLRSGMLGVETSTEGLRLAQDRRAANVAARSTASGQPALCDGSPRRERASRAREIPSRAPGRERSHGLSAPAAAIPAPWNHGSPALRRVLPGRPERARRSGGRARRECTSRGSPSARQAEQARCGRRPRIWPINRVHELPGPTSTNTRIPSSYARSIERREVDHAGRLGSDGFRGGPAVDDIAASPRLRCRTRFPQAPSSRRRGERDTLARPIGRSSSAPC